MFKDHRRHSEILMKLISPIKIDLERNKYHVNYYNRFADESERFCKEDGTFECPGSYNNDECVNGNKIGLTEYDNLKNWEIIQRYLHK